MMLASILETQINDKLVITDHEDPLPDVGGGVEAPSLGHALPLVPLVIGETVLVTLATEM